MSSSGYKILSEWQTDKCKREQTAGQLHLYMPHDGMNIDRQKGY